MTSSGLLGVMGTMATFVQKFNAKNEESMQKGGTADGINQEIEYWANLADALVYTMVDTVSSKVMEKFLRDYSDMLGFKAGLADLAGDSLGDYLKKRWYTDLNKFNDYKEKMDTDPDATPLENAERTVSSIVLKSIFPDSSLESFLFWEGANLREEDWANLIAIYGDDFKAGHQTNYNPFTPQMSDPLVIDADKDGFISTVSLADSEVYFDLTGNGVKTKTSWVKGNDAILVYDENEDGQISGIEEVFGNATTSGFDELRDTIDSNHDNKIDRRDILFNRLQLWHDYDQDGVVDEGELKSLKDIATIDLNSVQTTIDLEGTILTEASHYTDTTGNKELAADLELQYMPKVDSTISAGNAGSIDVDTIFLPQLRGYGYVANSLLSYNSDASLKELATKYANNIDLVANHFDLVANHFDEFVAKTIFTCKTFTTNKALHVKIQNTLKGVNDGAEKMVA
jgi:hypothetical protein